MHCTDPCVQALLTDRITDLVQPPEGQHLTGHGGGQRGHQLGPGPEKLWILHVSVKHTSITPKPLNTPEEPSCVCAVFSFKSCFKNVLPVSEDMDFGRFLCFLRPLCTFQFG